MCKEACSNVVVQENYIKARFLVFSLFSAHFYPQWIYSMWCATNRFIHFVPSLTAVCNNSGAVLCNHRLQLRGCHVGATAQVSYCWWSYNVYLYCLLWVLFYLMPRHLLPGNHVMPNQLAIVGAPDIYGQSARRLLQLLPTSCINAEKMFLESIKSSSYSVPSEPPREPTPPPPLTFTSSPSHLDQLEKPSPSRHLILPKPGNGGASGTTPGSNPFDQPFTRSRSGSNASSCSSHSISSGSTAPFTNATTLTSITGTASSFQFEYTPPEMAYFHYLETAREAINTCSMRCRCWSNLYDKCETSKEDLSPSEQLPPKSRELEDVQVRVISEDDVFSNSGNFRSRAVTVSHTRISRTTSLRTNSQLNSRSLQDGKNITSEDSSGLAQSYHLRRTGTVSTSPRTSPRQTRKFSDDSKSRFEDKIGLLLKVLLEKLSEMLKHSPTVNMLLTRLISRLAHFPQPLLRSLLLNHHLVLRPGVPNLLYVS